MLVGGEVCEAEVGGASLGALVEDAGAGLGVGGGALVLGADWWATGGVLPGWFPDWLLWCWCWICWKCCCRALISAYFSCSIWND